MKTRIKKIMRTLHLSGDNYYTGDDRLVLCGSFVEQVLPEKEKPAYIKVTISTLEMKGGTKIWIRHQHLGCCSPSSWTWEKDGHEPSHWGSSSGMFCHAWKLVTKLLGAKLTKLPQKEHIEGKAIPLYVRVVKVK